MAPAPIKYFNRYTGRVETEAVYGEAFMRWAYGHPLGRLAVHVLVKRAAFSRWYGWRMNRRSSRRKVLPFIAEYRVNAHEFAQPSESFKTFNEFFFRKLKPGARSIDPRPDAAVFPADGRHLGFQDLSKVDGIFVKGEVFGLAALLNDRALAKKYRDGTLILSRLCPVDCHRFHFPVAGVPNEPQLINGPLYSVNPIAVRQNIHIFSENRRWRGRICSGEFGDVLMLEIAATCVAGIDFTFQPGKPIAKGVEKGYFKFGGSSVITIFEQGRLKLDEDLVSNSREYRELYARMGDHMGKSCGP
jgi:phosphatidylserine decarboxylase